MAKRMRRDRKKEAEWRRHLRAQGRCGLSVRRYCEDHGLSEPTFYYWKREVARRDAERRSTGDARQPAFAEITVTGGDPSGLLPATQSGDSAIEVTLDGGRTIRVGHGFDELTFLRVLGLLEGAR